MADLSITAASVLASASAKKATGVAGASITAGQPVYVDYQDGSKVKLAVATSAAAESVAGIALHAALAGQPITYVVEDDDFTPGATLSLSAAAARGVYVLSAAAAGGIAPVSDLADTNRLVVLFVAKSTTKAKLVFKSAGVALVS